jgi:DNA polymerase elongation subunit (family B)
MKTLFLDIECSPTLATVWGLFKQTISINQLLGNSEILTWSAKWADSPDMLDGCLMRDGKRRMLRRMHRLLSEADAVVTWNGNGFDLKVLNKEFLLQSLNAPEPYKSIDLLAIARKRFRFTSNKLDYVAQQLGLGKKVEHRGHQLWLDCMARKREAFDEMLTYNRQDVVLLERIYDRLGSWVTGKPNQSIQDGHACPCCGSERLQARGWQQTVTRRYRRYHCRACGAWSRAVKSERQGAALREVA